MELWTNDLFAYDVEYPKCPNERKFTNRLKAASYLLKKRKHVAKIFEEQMTNYILTNIFEKCFFLISLFNSISFFVYYLIPYASL